MISDDDNVLDEYGRCPTVRPKPGIHAGRPFVLDDREETRELREPLRDMLLAACSRRMLPFRS
jgi:hypothetical protein